MATNKIVRFQNHAQYPIKQYHPAFFNDGFIFSSEIFQDCEEDRVSDFILIGIVMDSPNTHGAYIAQNPDVISDENTIYTSSNTTVVPATSKLRMRPVAISGVCFIYSDALGGISSDELQVPYAINQYINWSLNGEPKFSVTQSHITVHVGNPPIETIRPEDTHNAISSNNAHFEMSNRKVFKIICPQMKPQKHVTCVII